MTSILMWRKVQSEVDSSLPFSLKKVISRKLWDTDGSCGGGIVRVSHDFIPYLEGVADAGVPGANELIEIIREHEVLELWHED